MKKTTIFLAVIVAMVTVHPASGQQRMPGEVATPQATDLGRFGDVPVSLYTGTVNISIPLFSTTVRGVTLNASIDYDGSGVRVNSLPGPMGTSWTLNCGGVITRSANGGYDEYELPEQSFQECPVVPYFNYSSHHGVLEAAATKASLMATTVWQNIPYHDYEPDVFHFNFMGMTGSFFLGNDGQWKVRSDCDIEVLLDIYDGSNFDYPLYRYFPGLHPSQSNHNPESVSKTIKTIVLRDGQGNTYRFGGDNSSVEYSIGLLDMCEGRKRHSWKADSWYLTEVRDKYGNKLYEFRYTRGKYIAQVQNGYEALRGEGSGQSGWFPSTYYAYDYSYSYADTRYPYGVTVNSPVYLDMVICSNGVTFRTELSYYQKTAAQLFPSFYSRTGPLSDIYDLTGWQYGQQYLPFYYLQTSDEGFTSYQYTPNNKLADPLSVTCPKRYTRFLVTGGKDIFFYYNDTGRTFLDRVDMKVPGSDSVTASYRFRYDNSHLVPADCSTRMADHWGYYNGRDYSLPVTEAGFRAFRQLRDPDSTLMKYGSLSSIVYPTGGEAVITYGPHRFSQYVYRNRQYMCNAVSPSNFGGGLRVQSVTLYEDTTRTQVLTRKTYTYENADGTSSGELAGEPVYFWENWVADAMHPDVTIAITLFRTSSIVPLSNAFGPNVGYSRVVEHEYDGSRTEYTFSNFSGNLDYGQVINLNGYRPSPYAFFCERGYRRGKPLSKTVYAPDGTVVAHSGYSYGGDLEDSCYVLAASVRRFNDTYGVSTDYFIGGSYKIFYPHYDLATDTTRLLTDGTTTLHSYMRSTETVSLTSPYAHEASARILRSEAVIRGSETVRTVYGHPMDDGVPSAVSLLATKWFDLRPYWTKVFHGYLETQADSITFSTRTVNGESHPMPDVELARRHGEVTDTVVTYSEYTPTGQVRRYMLKGEQGTYLYWAYNDHYLVGRAVGGNNHQYYVSYDNVNCFNRDYMVGAFNNGRSHDSYASITSYTYDPVRGVTSVTDPRGNTVYYDYDASLRLSATLDLFRKTVSTYDYHFRETP